MSRHDPPAPAADAPQGPRKYVRPLVTVGVLLLAVLLMWGVGAARGGGDDQEPAAEAESSPSAVAPGNGQDEPSSSDGLNYATTVPPTREPTLSADGRQQAPSLDAWEPTAEEFATQWANPEGGKEAWLERLEPLTNDEAYEGLENTSETGIPDLEFDSVETYMDEGNQVVADASYVDEGAVLRMGLVPAEQGTGWVVAYVTEAD